MWTHSDVWNKLLVDFCIPLFNNIHLCGSALTEVFFVCAVSQVLYGALQDSFGTACNLTGDGALTMIVNKKIALSGKSL